MNAIMWDVMNETDVLKVLDALEEADLTAWVDGGWGIDALVGQTTREHSDLDLVISLPQVEAVRMVLG
ncbi:nucleotidyltransferase domain-containing protein [Streptosporangium lutulentum]